LGIVVIDLHGHIQAINKRAKSFLNMTDKSVNNDHIPTLLGDQYSILISNIFQGENFVRNKIKSNGKILEMMGSPLNGEKGVLLGAIITLYDITEIEKNQALEKNNEKYAAMGELSADIAHEIRNPLGSIKLLTSLLNKELRRKKDINRANQIMVAVKTMEKKISSLIYHSKINQIPITYVNIHDLLKDILLYSEKIIDRGSVFLSAQYANIEPIIKCNPDMMKQVFLNLILNALPEAVRLDIMTNYLKERGIIEIYFIEKSGSPPENIRTDILNRLSHTKQKNWGLGMAIVHNIVEMYDGYIRIEYLEDVGTAFVLSFPLASIKTSVPVVINHPIEKRKRKNEKK
jgi:signal transduction histidine kinase